MLLLSVCFFYPYSSSIRMLLLSVCFFYPYASSIRMLLLSVCFFYPYASSIRMLLLSVCFFYPYAYHLAVAYSLPQGGTMRRWYTVAIWSRIYGQTSYRMIRRRKSGTRGNRWHVARSARTTGSIPLILAEGSAAATAPYRSVSTPAVYHTPVHMASDGKRWQVHTRPSPDTDDT